MLNEMSFVKSDCKVACMNYVFCGCLMFASNTLILTDVSTEEGGIQNIDELDGIQPDIVVKDVFAITMGSDPECFLLNNVIDINPEFLYQIRHETENDQEMFNFFNNIGKGDN